MLNANSSRSQWSMIVLTLAMVAAFSVPMLGQEARGQEAPAVRVGTVNITGIPEDWSTHHVSFGNPGTEQDAIQSGHYQEWLKIVNDPRYVMQQLRKKLPVQGPAAVDAAYRARWISEASDGSRSSLEKSPEAISSGLSLRGLPPGPVTSKPKESIKTDWSESLGTGTGGLSAGQYPAKYSLETTGSSSSDFAVYPTGHAGSTTQATIAAFNNMYATTPATYWAYNTGGGTATLSPVISLDGTQVAFVQVTGGFAYLTILRMFNSGGPITGTGVHQLTSQASGTAYNNGSGTLCAAPCFVALEFNKGSLATQPTDTNSAPFYDYYNDALYVGDNSGLLHKFTGVFKGTPAEVVSSGVWPIAAGTGVLTSPVEDTSGGSIFVGSSTGVFYRYPSAGGALNASSTLTAGTVGIIDAPLIDTFGGTTTAYVFIGDDNAGSIHSAIVQFADAFTTGAGNKLEMGTSTGGAGVAVYSGAFDNIHYLGNAALGNLYFCGGTSGASTTPQLYQIALNSTFTSSTVNTVGNIDGTAATTCSPVTEFLGTKTAPTTLTAAISAVPSDTTLSGAVDNAVHTNSTTLSVAAGTVNAFICVGSRTNIAIGDYLNVVGTAGTETVYVTGITGTCTGGSEDVAVDRAQNGTTALNNPVGADVSVLDTLIRVPSTPAVAVNSYIQVNTEDMQVTGSVTETNTAGLTLTVTRAQLGTTIATHTSGTTVTALTSLSVASSTNVVATDYIQVDSDIMLVAGAPTGTTIIANQGVLGTTAATHLNGATVTDIQDWVYASVTAGGSDTGCTGDCLYNYLVTSGTSPAASSAGYTATGGTSGIIIDNNVVATDTSNIYFGVLSTSAAVQTTQAAP